MGGPPVSMVTSHIPSWYEPWILLLRIPGCTNNGPVQYLGDYLTLQGSLANVLWFSPALVSFSVTHSYVAHLGMHIHAGETHTIFKCILYGYSLSKPLNLNSNVVFLPHIISIHCDKWQHTATLIWINIGLGNGLLPGGTKPLPEPILTPY